MPLPFIVTAELPPDLHSWADALRQRHFPPERNWLKAHVTLFHAFAPSLRDELMLMLPGLAAQFAPPAAQLHGLMNLGRGTALAISSPAMLAIRQQIADRFHGALTAQDSHRPRLHITIQNKVDPAQAKALQSELGLRLKSRSFQFSGFGLHRYCNPHWEAVQTWSFRGKEGG